MKKVFIYSSAAMLLGLASCSQEEMPVNSNGDGNATFTISLSSNPGTRTFSDGLTADDLEMAIYDAATDNLVQVPAPVKFGNALSTTVNFQLANGRAYKIAFFAHKKDGSAYTFDAANKLITVDYSKMASDYNTDNYDCFYTLFTTGTITGPINENVVLNRPVAQVNWGTSDIKHPAVTAPEVYDKDANGEAKNLVAKVKSVTAYTQFDMFKSDVVETSAEAVELDYISRPTGESFPVDPATYTYLSMSYLLMPAAGTNVDLTLDVTSNAATSPMSTILVTNAPLQANYRTNIYGALLTTPAEFTVTKDKEFNKPDNNVEVAWDGTSVSDPVLNEATGNYEIQTPSQLAGLAKLVNEHPAEAENVNYLLTADIDMGGHEWTPIGIAKRLSSIYTGKAFKGTFDGGGKTISNFKLTNEDLYSGGFSNDAAFGLFGVVDGGEVKNLTVESVNINLPGNELTGAAVGLLTNGGKVSDIKVVSGTINVMNGGGIVGRVMKSGTIENCTNGAAVNGTKDNLGGIVGTVYNLTGTVTISNCENTGAITSSVSAVGGIAGYNAGDIENCKNSGTVTGTFNVGGIAGNQKSAGSVKNSINDGKIVATAAGDECGAGGIVGAIDYWGAVSARKLIVVSGNTNNGAVSSKARSGGIVGLLGHGAEITANINNVSDIQGDYVAGVVGVYRGYKHQDDVDFKIVLTGNQTVAVKPGITRTDNIINWWTYTADGQPQHPEGLDVTEENNTVKE